MEAPQHRRRGLQKRCAGQAARLASLGRAQALRAGDRGVADDDPVQPMGDHGLDNGLDLTILKVGRDLQEDRIVAGRAGLQHRPGLGQTAQQFLQRRPGLQGAQARRVGRGDVGGEIVRQPPQAGQAGDIVLDAVGRVLVGPDIGPDIAMAAGAPRQAFGEDLKPLVVEAHAVDHRLVLRQAKQARARIAVLRQGRDSARLDKAEAGGQHGVGHLGVLVEAGGQAHAAAQMHAGQGDRQQRIIRRPVAGPKAGLQRLDGQAMGVFRIEGVQRPGGQIVQAHAVRPPSCGTPSASRSRDAWLTTSAGSRGR